jgi:hypothetical protein
MAERGRVLWDTAVDRIPPVLAAVAAACAAVGLTLHLIGASSARLFLAAALLAGVSLFRRLTPVRLIPSRGIVYHSDEDGLLVACGGARVLRLQWDAITEMREGALGSLILVSRDVRVRLPRRIARRAAFGMAAFERIVPRLASDLWDGLTNGRMVVVGPKRQSAAVAVALGLAVGAALTMPSVLGYVLAGAAVTLVVLAAVQPGRRPVFISARGIGDRDRFIAWNGAELAESRFTLAVRDPETGWVARIPRTAANYHAIAVVARTAQALSGAEVESVAFRSTHDGENVRIVVEGTRAGRRAYH